MMCDMVIEIFIHWKHEKAVFCAPIAQCRIHAPIRDAPPSMVSLDGAKKQPFPASRDL